MRRYHVYIMANRNNRVLYTGVTANLAARVHQHRNKLVEGFTSRYNVTKLVYAEEYTDVKDAIAREKEIKGGSRGKRLALIARANPQFRELRTQ